MLPVIPVHTGSSLTNNNFSVLASDWLEEQNLEFFKTVIPVILNVAHQRQTFTLSPINFDPFTTKELVNFLVKKNSAKPVFRKGTA